MSEAELFQVLGELISGQMSPQAWLQWWQEHQEAVRPLIKPGEFLRLKPKLVGRDEGEYRAEASIGEAKRILDARKIEYNVPAEVAARREAEWQDYLNRIEFGGTALGIAMKEFAANTVGSGVRFTDRLYDEFIASGEKDEKAWLRKRLKEMFLCVGARPKWRDEPQWPVADGNPMVFVTQADLPDNEVTAALRVRGMTAYFFVRRASLDTESLRIEAEVVLQDR